MRKPTVLGQSARTQGDLPQPAAVPAVSLDTGAIVLRPEQAPAVQEALASLDFASIAPGEIIAIGLPAEQALQQTLDGFLGSLDRETATEVFTLFRRLEKGVDDAKLPEILERIQQGDRPGRVGQFLGKITGKSAEDVAQDVLDDIRKLITGSSTTLEDVLNLLQGEFDKKMQRLLNQLDALNRLKRKYGEHFDDFTVDAAVARAFLHKAQTYVAAQEAALKPGDVAAQTRLQELQAKLRLLESRALALEGTYTRLPTTAIVIQQIEDAGVSTLQETATTMNERFTSIKETLLALNGAFGIKAVQQLASRSAKLDAQLSKVRGELIKDVAVTAARAPGENRLAQAQRIEETLANMAEVHGLVQAAEAQTDQNFEVARQKFAAARAQFATLATR